MNSNVQVVSTDTAIELVSDRFRRRILLTLIQSDEEAIDLETLLDAIDSPAESVATARSRRNRLVSLQHNHLPKLAECGVIDYDFRSETVRYNETTSVEKLLSFVTDELT